MSVFTGRVRCSDLEGGRWTLITDLGVLYQLKGGSPDLYKDGLRVEVQGTIAKNTVGIAMMGEVLEVKSYRLIG